MSLGNKEIMAKNIKRLMALNQVNATDVCTALGFEAPTFSDWVNAKTYPRIDKIEAMSNYFGVSKADLVEEQPPPDAYPYNPTQRIPILGRFPAGSSCYLPLMLGYHCGMRLGEVFGLTWDDIDFDARTLTVRRQVQEIGGRWTLVPPKYESVRTITLDSQMLDALRDAQNRQQQAQSDYDEYYTYLYLDSSGVISGSQSGTPVFLVNVRENGEYIQPRVTQHLCKVAHRELDMPEFDFHTLRHTHTTMLIEAGVSPLVVQERLGHKNIQTTLGIYAEVTETMRDIAGSVIDQIYSK